MARWGRFVTAHAGVVFTVLLLAGLALATTSALVRLGAADQGTQPIEQTSRRAYDLLAEGFGAGFNGPIPIVVDVNVDPGAPQRVFDGVQGLEGEGVASVGEPQLNDKKTVPIVFVTPDSAPQDEETDRLASIGSEATWCRLRPRGATRSPTSRARRRRSRTSPTLRKRPGACLHVRPGPALGCNFVYWAGYGKFWLRCLDLVLPDRSSTDLRPLDR